MKGHYESDDDMRIAAGAEPVGGTYVDARGFEWHVTVQPPDGGTGRLTWLAKSDNDVDNGRWFSDQDRDRMFKSIDAFVDEPKGSDVGGLLLLALALYLLTSKRR